MTLHKRAFEKFYQQHVDKLYRFVYFRVGQDADMAQDLVSEIFMKVLEHFAEYDETKSKSAWLMTIARNHLANHWRDRKPTQSLMSTTEDGEVDDESIWIRSSLEAWQKREASETITALLVKLDDVERAIVTFHYILGYSYAEIASERGMSEGNVKVISHRALKKLRQYL